MDDKQDDLLQDKLTRMTGKKFVKQRPNTNAQIKSVLTEVDGRVFHSKAEANRYSQLKLLKAKGEIEDFMCQYPKLIIVPTHIHPVTGNVVRELTYTPDFCIKYPDGRVVYEDVKGLHAPLTNSFKDKKKIVEYLYKIVIEIVRM